MPSLCGMFVYKDVTSTVTKREMRGRDGSFSMRLRKCFVFWEVARLDEMGDVGREKVSWIITTRNNRVEKAA